MTLNERYRYRSGNKKGFIKILVVLSIFSAMAFTFSRYNNSSASNTVLKVAKWKIVVNNQDVSSGTSNISGIPIIKETGLNDGIIRNGDTGYFEIQINPSNTEVSVEYIINLSCVKQPSTVLSDMDFEYYSLNNEVEKHDIVGNSIDGTTGDKKILLNGKNSLDSNDIKNYKIYWKWTGRDIEVNLEDCKINANMEIRQSINS